MWVVVLVADQDALARPPHAAHLVVFLQPLQPCKHRWVLFWLSILSAECVIAERVQAYRLWLVAIEVLGENRAAIVSA